MKVTAPFTNLFSTLYTVIKNFVYLAPFPLQWDSVVHCNQHAQVLRMTAFDVLHCVYFGQRCCPNAACRCAGKL